MYVTYILPQLKNMWGPQECGSVVEHFLSMHMALCLIPSTARKQTRKGWAQWLIAETQATPEALIRSIKVWGQPGQKVSKTPFSINKLGMVVCSCNPSYVGGIGSRIVTQAKTQDPFWKIRTSGMAQVAECLPSKHRSLSSNPRTAKKN
jgi:hypothetical protein